MQVYLFNTKASLPEDDGNHVLVFAGRGSLLRDGVTDMVTEVICTYRVGDTSIQFPRNGDAANVRFEQAFSWAVKYAAAHGIERVYGVFELSRPLDNHYMNRTCPGGIIDKRDPVAVEKQRRLEAPVLCDNCAREIPSPSLAGAEPLAASCSL